MIQYQAKIPANFVVLLVACSCFLLLGSRYPALGSTTSTCAHYDAVLSGTIAEASSLDDLDEWLIRYPDSSLSFQLISGGSACWYMPFETSGEVVAELRAWELYDRNRAMLEQRAKSARPGLQSIVRDLVLLSWCVERVRIPPYSPYEEEIESFSTTQRLHRQLFKKLEQVVPGTKYDALFAVLRLKARLFELFDTYLNSDKNQISAEFLPKVEQAIKEATIPFALRPERLWFSELRCRFVSLGVAHIRGSGRKDIAEWGALPKVNDILTSALEELSAAAPVPLPLCEREFLLCDWLKQNMFLAGSFRDDHVASARIGEELLAAPALPPSVRLAVLQSTAFGYRSQGNMTRALELYREAVALEPTKVNFQHEIEVLSRMKEKKEAAL